jgi:prepilin-type N-terminal cleavage/methylation domain-containing protein
MLKPTGSELMMTLKHLRKNRSDIDEFGSHGFSLAEVLIVVFIVLVIAAIGIPNLMTMVGEMRTAGDARDLNGAIVLAKMRSASNFSRARVYADLSANTFRVEWQQSGTNTWTSDACPTNTCIPDIPLATGVSFGYGSVPSPPSNTQGTLGQAPVCLNSSGSAIANTACIMFNSRGIPITSGAVPTPNDAIYVTDGRLVTGVTVSATGLTKIWRTDASGANWKQR